MTALKTQKPVAEPHTYTANTRVEKQRVSMTSKPQAESAPKPQLKHNQIKGPITKKPKSTLEDSTLKMETFIGMILDSACKSID